MDNMAKTFLIKPERRKREENMRKSSYKECIIQETKAAQNVINMNVRIHYTISWIVKLLFEMFLYLGGCVETFH